MNNKITPATLPKVELNLNCVKTNEKNKNK